MPIDLRSDTITQPTRGMREAIATAEVGDDVLGDDPTVQQLERFVAGLLGKEAAVFMPSGTMTNQIALRTHTEPGDEVILESQAHIYYYEGGGPAALSGVMCRLINGDRGVFTAADVETVLRPADVHFPKTKLVCLENTHNRGGGKIYPLSEIDAIAQVCKQHGLKLHLDGARLWNACIATNTPEDKYVKAFDSVSVCFSKGLGAPIGSALAGSHDFIERARRFRKMFGGGMRQAGMMAAGAIYALKHHRAHLKEDHLNAQTLAKGLAEIPGIIIDPIAVETNIVVFHTKMLRAQVLVDRLKLKGVYVLPVGPKSIRAVTNLMVTEEQILQVPDLVDLSLNES
ncbi:threonine aldolase [Leptolyngbya sp. PCC 7375]|nr:threonine aldolase [Leptolyngbya sp. PCC 7375]